MSPSKWYYCFISVDYTAKKGYREYYNPGEPIRIIDKQGFSVQNAPFSNALQLVLGAFASNICGPCGTIANLFAVTDYFEEENMFMFGNGLESTHYLLKK